MKNEALLQTDLDGTTHSQHSRALGIHTEFWVMRSDVPQLSGPLTGCSDWTATLTGGVGLDKVF